LLKLRRYQRQGVKFLISRENALLADEMGLGKTVQAIIAFYILLKRKIISKILIICPASLCLNWENELRHWASELTERRINGNKEDRRANFRLPFQIWDASYEQIRDDIEFLRNEMAFDLIVLDEAQRIKNKDSSTALACRQLRRNRAWALTGTPIENKIEDLLSIFAFIKPQLLNEGLARDEIHAKMAPFFLRRRKQEVLREPPEIIEQNLVLEMENRQCEAYDSMCYNIRSDIRKKVNQPIAITELLAQITKLKQLCNFDPESGDSCKFDALKSIIEEVQSENGKIIIFSQYVETLKYINNRLNSPNADLFYGELGQEERNSIVNTFEQSSESKILLVSLRAGGPGGALISCFGLPFLIQNVHHPFLRPRCSRGDAKGINRRARARVSVHPSPGLCHRPLRAQVRGLVQGSCRFQAEGEGIQDKVSLYLSRGLCGVIEKGSASAF